MWYKRTIPLIIVFVLGILAFAHNFVPHQMAASFRETMSEWMVIAGGFALFIGIYSLLHMHVTRIRRQTTGWAYSVFVFIGAAAMIALGLWNDGAGPLQSVAPGHGTTWYDWGFDTVLLPCQATIFSLLAFFMASAAFRTFRVRNFSAGLLLVAALIVMFGRVPIWQTVTGWFGVQPAFAKGADGALSVATDAIMEYPNLAASRAIILGISLGAISQSLRILFGIERSYLGGGD